MVMELAPLGSLYAYLKNITTWYKKLKALTNISQGLFDLHNSNLTHGDFHPGNLLFKSSIVKFKPSQTKPNQADGVDSAWLQVRNRFGLAWFEEYQSMAWFGLSCN